ncbi:MAG: molecular chaperone HscC [Polyangiales bacterium]|jgi:molecular chaperone HscC
MKVIGEDKVEHMVIEQAPGSLTKRELEAARRSMAALKFHPRETLPNRTLLARGDALFGELKGIPRDELAHSLAIFRATLEVQDPGPIEEAASNLRFMIDALRPRNG